jgi:hypothetical protein
MRHISVLNNNCCDLPIPIDGVGGIARAVETTTVFSCYYCGVDRRNPHHRDTTKGCEKCYFQTT